MSFVFLLIQGPITYLDTNAYFGLRPYVSAGYPFFLRSLHFIFKENYLNAVVGIQFIAIIISIYVFVFCFLKHFHLKIYQYITILLLLFYPVFDSNVYTVTSVSTEGVSFALFLQVIHLSYRVFIQRKFKSAVLLCLFVVILITIRGQFQFLILVFLLTELVLSFYAKKLKLKYIIVFLMIPLSVFVIDNVYHKIIHKQYFSTPFVWTAFVTPVLFVADDTDVEYLETENQKEIFNLVKSKFKAKGVDNSSHKYYEEPIDYNYFFYHYELPTLCNQTVKRDVLDYYLLDKEKSLPNVLEAHFKLEKTHKELFFELLPHVFKKWFKLVFQSFKTGIGGMPIVLVYVLSLILLFLEYVKNQNKLVLWAFFLLLVVLVNRVLISVSVHGLTRYFFYTHWIAVFLLFLGINNFVSKRNKS
ncbi:hypothetical protein [Pseudofulvibacter geojedonensis]|uniref:Glycosyltransferase RgtA/B/C/D-like domain-containing protein n=1 Tax=Pseudofulvibacter geojedonensis TaxID=1123758 RepID=A0ABW3I5B8_9FLAO